MIIKIPFRQRWFSTLVIFLVIVFLFVLPKGGVGMGDIPITWSYIILALAGGGCSIWWIGRWGNARDWLAWMFTVPFGLWVIMIIAINGMVSLGYAASMILNSFLLPFLMLLPVVAYIRKFGFESILSWIQAAVFWAACLGIVFFVYRVMVGDFFEIPYVTVNAADVGELGGKFNMRGDLPKLVSTYNNGNIYGVCALMFLPLVDLRRNLIFSLVVRSALILTTSRTVWIGLVCYEFIRAFYIRKIKIRSIFLVTISLVAAAGAVLATLSLFGISMDFLTDRQLGGRLVQFEELQQVKIVPSLPFEVITEVVWLSIFRSFGYVGGILFFFSLIGPILIYFLQPRFGRYEIQRAILSSIVIYWIICWSDGAYMLIPVMAQYWLLVGMLAVITPISRRVLPPRHVTNSAILAEST